MTNDKIFKQIRFFVSTFSAIPENKIDINSKLENDLKIYGDDTFDLIKAYSERFNVDLKNFKPSKYIAPEGDTILITLLEALKKNKEQRYDLTISNLVNGVIAGKLDDEVIG